MDVTLFGTDAPGDLVTITGSGPGHGDWEHQAFVPHRLPDEQPPLSQSTHRAVADARAELAALDSTARLLPNPHLLRQPSLRREAQSTSALEGTYEPLSAVLTADAEAPESLTMREVLNFVRMAEQAFDAVAAGYRVTSGLLSSLQATLVQGTPAEGHGSGDIRETQVVIGQRSTAPVGVQRVEAARFVPAPPGPDLRARVQDLVDWMNADRRDRFDPVVAAAMVHYQFETLHPFHDGNGRIGRLLIVLQLLHEGTLSEPTLTVSPWFEARRPTYYDALFGVSAQGDWDTWVAFFARGLQASALQTRTQMVQLDEVRTELKELVRQSKLRAVSAQDLVDYAVAHPTFSVRQAEKALNLSYGRVNQLVHALTDLGVLASIEEYNRRFYAPRVMEVLIDAQR